VLMSIDALSRPWLNFEMGVAWSQKTRIIICCHKGLTPTALPRPYSSLQSVDLNNLNHTDRLDTVAQAVAHNLNVPLPTETPATASTDVALPVDRSSFASTYRTWTLRPVAHIGETVRHRFLVGSVSPSRPDRAIAVELEPGETLYVRLFTGTTPEGHYVPVMVAGEIAAFFELVQRDTVHVLATLRLAGTFDDAGNILPFVVIDEFEEAPIG